MTYRGIIQNGVVVLEPGANLPEGTSVRVDPEPVAPPAADSDADLDPAFRIGDLAGPTGIPDLGINIDHYLYGHPKVTDAGGKTLS